MPAPSVPAIVPGPPALLATTGVGRLGAHRTTGALALAPVFPLALTEPSLATTPDTGTPPASRPAPDRSGLWLSAPPSTERTRRSEDSFSPDVLATTAP